MISNIETAVHKFVAQNQPVERQRVIDEFGIQGREALRALAQSGQVSITLAQTVVMT